MSQTRSQRTGESLPCSHGSLPLVGLGHCCQGWVVQGTRKWNPRKSGPALGGWAINKALVWVLNAPEADVLKAWCPLGRHWKVAEAWGGGGSGRCLGHVGVTLKGIVGCWPLPPFTLWLMLRVSLLPHALRWGAVSPQAQINRVSYTNMDRYFHYWAKIGFFSLLVVLVI